MPVNTNEWQKTHPWENSPASHPQPVPLVTPSDLFNPLLTIADVMKREAPICSPDTTVAEAVRIMRDSAASGVFVVTADRPIGLLTDRAVALAAIDRADELGRLTVKDLMTVEVPMVPADARLGVLLDNFADAGVAVIDSNRHLQGVVRWVDLLGHLSERALGVLVASLFRQGHSQARETAR